MKILAVIAVVTLSCVSSFANDLPTDESGAIAFLKTKNVDIKIDADGHAVRIMSSGKTTMTADEYQLIGLLTHLEQIGINAAPLSGDQWSQLWFGSARRLARSGMRHAISMAKGAAMM